jgi:hypothetical protein
MNKETIRHIAMVNSFNVITSRSSVEEVMEAGIGYFGHEIGGEFDSTEIRRVLKYFESLEMYEYCSELSRIINELDRDMPMCECDYPLFDTYSPSEVGCLSCGNPIVKSIE